MTKIVHHQWIVAIQFVSELDSYIFGVKESESILLSKKNMLLLTGHTYQLIHNLTKVSHSIRVCR